VFYAIIGCLIIIILLFSFYKPARENFLKITGWAIGATETSPGGVGTGNELTSTNVGDYEAISFGISGERGTYTVYIDENSDKENPKVFYKKNTISFISPQKEGFYYFDFYRDLNADVKGIVYYDYTRIKYILTDSQKIDEPMPEIQEASEEETEALNQIIEQEIPLTECGEYVCEEKEYQCKISYELNSYDISGKIKKTCTNKCGQVKTITEDCSLKENIKVSIDKNNIEIYDLKKEQIASINLNELIEEKEVYITLT